MAQRSGPLIDPKIREHRGRIVKTTGDGVLVEFASVVDAVRCAVEVQRGMGEREPDLARAGKLATEAVEHDPNRLDVKPGWFGWTKEDFTLDFTSGVRSAAT